MNILLCDDNEAEIKKMTHILEYSFGSGLKTVAFRNVSEALSYIRKGAVVDVCFLETVTPGMNGIELANNLRAEGYTGEIIFLTKSREYGTEPYRVKALDYLLKPVMQEQVRYVLSIAEKKMKERRSRDKPQLFSAIKKRQ